MRGRPSKARWLSRRRTRRGEWKRLRNWCRWPPCSPISSASPKPTLFTGGWYDGYNAISPFPLAWACFQLGMLWGELVPVPDREVAALWYRRALGYLPAYVRARVHLAEIYLSQDQTNEAEALLQPALTSGDPEVRWRLAEVLMAQDRLEEAESEVEAARLGFEQLLARYLASFCRPCRRVLCQQRK